MAKKHNERHGAPPVRNRPQPPNKMWDLLNNYRAELRNCFTSPALVAPLLRSPAVMERITGDTLKRLQQLLEILLRDVTTYVERLDSIQAKHPQRSGSTENPDEHFQALQVFEQYYQQGQSYQMVVVPVLDEVLGIFRDADIQSPVNAVVLPSVPDAPASDTSNA